MTFLIFASWNKSPIASPGFKKTYEGVMPFVHALLGAAVFLVIPLVIMIGTFVNLGAIGDSQLSALLWIYFLTSVCLMPWLPMQIIPIYRAAIGFYKQKQTVAAIRGNATTWEEVSVKPEYANFLQNKKSQRL